MKQKTVLKACAFICAVLLSVATANAGAGHDHAEHGHDHSAHVEKSSEHARTERAGGSSHDEHGEHEHGEHGHKHVEKKAGPNGGRLVTSAEPHFEFLATPERFVQITFVGRDEAVVPVAEQSISLIGGARSAPVKLEFVKKEGRLISTKALPDMKNMPIVLQIQATPDSKKVREKFYLNLSNCGSCSYKKYACVCGH
ncbi:MAG: hypothetical protein ACN4GF_00480 [Lentimonas sp.]